MSDTILNLENIKQDFKSAVKEFGLSEVPAPQIIAVSKTFATERVEPLLAAGHRVFGENRVQEAMKKWPPLRKKYENIELHLIGPLQTNKVKEAVWLFDVIETLDREKLAKCLALERDKGAKLPRLLIQVNTGEEEQKSGVVPLQADQFIQLCINQFNLPVTGVMCIPPAHEEPAPHFALLKKIADRNGLKVISMGMSADYKIAAAMGATHVRIGSAIFGERRAPGEI